MESTITLTYDADKSNRVKVVLEFDADPQLSDPEKDLQSNVISHHLLAIQAAPLCLTVADNILRGVDDTILEEEAAKKKAEIDAEVAKKKAARSTLKVKTKEKVIPVEEVEVVL